MSPTGIIVLSYFSTDIHIVDLIHVCFQSVNKPACSIAFADIVCEQYLHKEKSSVHLRIRVEHIGSRFCHKISLERLAYFADYDFH